MHKLATQYFNLPSNHVAAIEDATKFVKSAQQSPSIHKYDYIIHDVFTGGTEPAELFTLEFLKDLSSLLKDDGVIAIVSHNLLLPACLNSISHIIFRITPETLPSTPQDSSSAPFYPSSHPAASSANRHRAKMTRTRTSPTWSSSARRAATHRSDSVIPNRRTSCAAIHARTISFQNTNSMLLYSRLYRPVAVLFSLRKRLTDCTSSRTAVQSSTGGL